MPTKRKQVAIQINQLVDAVLIAAVYWLVYAARESLAFWLPGHWPLIAPFRVYKWLYLIILPVYPLLLDWNGFYDRPLHTRFAQSLWILTKSAGLCLLLVVAVLYFLGFAAISRGVVLLFGAVSVLALFGKDLLYQWSRQRAGRRGRFLRPVVLVGSEAGNAEFEALLATSPEWGLHVAARLNPAVESFEKLPEYLHRQPISCVIFNVGQERFSEVEKAVAACEIEGVEAWLVADFLKTKTARVTADTFLGKPLLVFRTAPDVSWQLFAKRALDLVAAGLGLLVLGPLVMLPVALIIKLTSQGPVFFRQKRCTMHGRLFTMLKFRSMVTNAEMLQAELQAFNEMSGPVFKMASDPRITPFGRFLRRSSLDELPQLWNVLTGDMSLVGPRPLIDREVERFDPWHRRRLSMKPGLTCLWQISGRNEIDFDQWMKLDLQYIDHWSFWLDLKILARTIPVVLGGLGAR
jgi:exopolysaccharide biosynthesis polyprenyl glycosylphosphotransferase